MNNKIMAGVAMTLLATGAHAVEAELYGQVNKGLFAFDDGLNTDVVVVDNNYSSTRFGLKGKEKLDNGLTVLMHFEGEMVSNGSHNFVQNTTANQSATPNSTATVNFSERLAFVGLSGDFGALTLGQQAVGTNDAYTQDLVGAKDVMGAENARIGGGLRFRNANNTLNAITVNNLAGPRFANRTDSIKYATPSFNGFSGQTSISQGGDFDVAVAHKGGFSGFKTAASVGYLMDNDQASSNVTNNIVESRMMASGSVKHDSGLAATVAYTKGTLENKTVGAKSPEGYYAKVGYAWDALEVAADYGVQKNQRSVTVAKDELKSFGLAVQHELTKGVSVAALYRNFDATVTANNLQDIDVYGVNMRVKF